MANKQSTDWYTYRSIILVLIETISIYLFSCNNPFSIREGEPPIHSQLIWSPPTEPGIVIENLQSALANSNLSYYIRCLGGDFIFLADENERSTINPDAWKYQNWNFDIEQSAMTRLFNFFRDTIRADNPVIDVNFSRTSQADVILPGDSARLYRDYEIKIYHNYPQYPSYCRGTLLWTMKADPSGFWTITHWSDLKIDSLDWGAFKGIFRF